MFRGWSLCQLPPLEVVSDHNGRGKTCTAGVIPDDDNPTPTNPLPPLAVRLLLKPYGVSGSLGG